MPGRQRQRRVRARSPVGASVRKSATAGPRSSCFGWTRRTDASIRRNVSGSVLVSSPRLIRSYDDAGSWHAMCP